ncbi:hypothetical protein [Sphingosinicella microcystinivorans]|uniref:hypothetical protein n=1 Tax=Sphingosinicella microcystinivorans TaxID=335406 RepID=UPI0022F39BB1|nr:hypothetical protein [Sphingosinicella microcystinivorans]WBX84788.1 hypothetical protein PE061_02380 [Sphingosinicella microcystinivorans]
MSLSPDSFTRRTLLLDAAMSGACAVLLVAGAGALADPLGLPEALLRVSGLVLVPFVGLLVWLMRAGSPSAIGVRAVVAINLAWVAASAALLFSGLVDPTSLGTAFVIVQALAVLVFAELQIAALRRTASLRAA